MGKKFDPVLPPLLRGKQSHTRKQPVEMEEVMPIYTGSASNPMHVL